MGFEWFVEWDGEGFTFPPQAGLAGKTRYARISGGGDLRRLIDTTPPGSVAVVETSDWSIIPYENLIAELHLKGAQVYAVGEPSDLNTLFTVMEKGVDGVIVRVSSKADLERVRESLISVEAPRLLEAEVTEIVQVGLGDRVCVDTTSILSEGEGLLVGNTADFFFLVHNENIQTEYTEARPFRVNAGAVHCYVLQANGRTNYLSELRAGSRVLVVSKKGAREVVVGRAKIERRPLALVRARVGEREGSVVLQWAETIRLVGADGKPVSITQLGKGSKVLAHLEEHVGRHFGARVEEFIIEK